MATNDPSKSTDEPTATDGTTRREAMEQATSDSGVSLSRRGAMKTTAGLTAAGLAGASATGSAAGNIPSDGFSKLSVSSDNRIVTEDGDTFVMRGVNIPDPKRLERTRYIRGKEPIQLLDKITDNSSGWHPRVVRVPAQPQDIGEHPMGHAGPEYEDGELESPDVVADDRRKMQPPQPVAFTEDELQDYLENYYDPIVERCKERGVYCIVDFHRHWHEQPPGKEDPSAAENHLPYDSPYTCYWAYNDHEEFGKSVPGSWGHVDQVTITELTPEYDGWAGITSESDIEGSPYAYENWQVNEELLEEAQMFWEAAAQRYGDMDHVIFEPYNEPTSPGIWGPVDGCGAIKQKPLWETFVDDFMGPIIDTIRQYQEDQVLLVGVPGWCQSLQGLHWYDFNDAGYDNIACTWHNYAGHDVSQLHNWLNDTDYQSVEDVEAETGEELENPYLEPPSSVTDPDCWGWEGYEAAGLQEAMDYHPIAVTEFGWVNNTEVSHWLRGSTTGQGTTNKYGIPFFEAMESDDRLSWVAWVADVRWHPTMFEFPNGPNEGELADSLENTNFYDPDFEDLPQPCPNPPCEWEILGGEDSGEYIKDRLAAFKDDIPFDTEERGPGTHVFGDGPDNCTTVDGQQVCDVNEDGHYRDITGDGSVGQTDVVNFFEVQHRSAWKQPDMFDFSGNGSVGHGDVVELFEYVATQA